MPYAKKCVYYPYLGKNDHPADITNAGSETAKLVEFKHGRLECLMPKEAAEVHEPDFDDLDDLDGYTGFKYEEALPCGMDEWTNHYIMETYLYTDAAVETQAEVYQLEDGKKLYFIDRTVKKGDHKRKDGLLFLAEGGIK